VASSVAASDFAAGTGRGTRELLRNPTFLYCVAALIILGGCALNAALGHWANQANRDLYQHVAALRALITNLSHPANPFVVSAEGSRHFHPYWVMMAALARIFGWTVWQTVAVASFFSMAVMGAGIFVFAREYYRSAWGPIALLLCALLGWTMPISHTGFINVPTLVEGASYPAPLVAGLSFVLWALVIRTMRDVRNALLIVPLTAIMFATHQLGAGLALIVGTSLFLFWPEGSVRARGAVALAFAGGLLLSAAWPYQDPFVVLFKAGNPTWENGVEWYIPKYLIGFWIPSAIGLLGLWRPVVPGTGRPLLAVLPILILGFFSGAAGFMTGTRFAPTAILLLQIGMAAILTRLLESPASHSDKFKKVAAATAFGTIVFQVVAMGFIYYPKEYRDERRFGSVYKESEALTAAIPDNQQIAAYDVAALPIAATGQKVLSIPWPEPMISDLSQRQALTERLFDPHTSKEQRIALAKAVGIRTLILDVRFGPKRMWEYWEVYRFNQQARRSTAAGPMRRYDLY
jgi:hypothetical protein